MSKEYETSYYDLMCVGDFVEWLDCNGGLDNYYNDYEYTKQALKEYDKNGDKFVEKIDFRTNFTKSIMLACELCIEDRVGA